MALKGAGKTVLAAASFLLGVAFAFAQAPQKPAVDADPKFEIRRFTFEGATLVSQEQLEAVTAPFTGKDRGFGDVQRALEAIERTYSGAGYSAVQVVLPEQELERGEIRFTIVEAKIGRILVEGNKFFDEANVRASVPSLQAGKAPNIDHIARNLRVANENPAKQTTVLLRSGQEEAAVDAVVRVVDEPPTRASVTVDTSGTDQTGKFRVGFGFQNGNVRNLDHVLTLQFVTAPHAEGYPNRLSLVPSKKVFVLGMGYRIPLYESGDSLDFTAGYSNVNSGTVANLFTIAGAGGILGARYTKNLDKIGDYEHRLAFSLDHRGYHNKGVRAVGGTEQLIPDITVHPVSLLYSGLYRRQDSETAGSFGFSKNFAGGNDGRGPEFCLTRNATVSGHFECAQANYFIWRWSLNHSQLLGDDWQARFAMNGQWTRDMLVSGEQFGIGGADSVRGFLEREVTNDNGYRGTLELYSPDWGGKIPLSGLRARALLFADWGRAWRNRPSPSEAHGQHIGSFGIGFRFARGNNLSLRVDFGWVSDAGGVQGKNDARLHASFSYVF